MSDRSGRRELSREEPAESRRTWTALTLSVGGVVLAALLGIAIVARAMPGVADAPPPSPAGTLEPEETPTPDTSAASPSAVEASPTPAATPEPSLALDWVEAGSFNDSAGPAFVHDLVRVGDAMLAAGVQYHHQLPNLGPTPPHDGRIWESLDGRHWTDVTPEDGFANVSLGVLHVAPDGSVLVLGHVSEEADGQLWPGPLAAWESTDRRAWSASSVLTGMPEASWRTPAVGAPGYLTQVDVDPAAHASDLWFSADGRSWERVYSMQDSQVSIGAGDDGFVVVGYRGVSDEVPQPFAIASGDGRQWFEAPSPPSARWIVAMGGDWLAGSDSLTGGRRDSASIFFSTDGLAWTELGSMPLAAVRVEGGTCFEYVDGAAAAGRWILVSTVLSYPCGEGGFFVHGTQRISSDGAEWVAIPLPPGAPGQQGGGSSVRAALPHAGGIVAAGDSNGRATFWVAEPAQ